MRKFFNIFLISLMVFSLFANFALAEDVKTIDFNKSVKNFSYSIDGKQTTDQILISKLSDKDLDRNNDNLKIVFIKNNLINTIRIEDNNTKGGIFYIPYETCIKLLGDAPYGINDYRYDPKLVEIDHIKYYQFDITHFSTVDITDWASYDHASRVPIIVNSTALAGDVNNAIVVLKISDANCSGAITDGDDDNDDFRFYALNESGGSYGTTVTECDYDAFDWNTDSGGNIAIEIPFLDSASDATIYMYYDGDGDWDDPAGTYANGIGVYHFESAVTDSTGNQDGTANSITYDTGKIGSGAVFNGFADYVAIGDYSNWNYERTQAMTIMWWTNKSGYDASFWFSKSEASGNYRGFESQQANDGIMFALVNNGLYHATVKYNNTGLSGWQHYVWTYSGNSDVSGIKLYIGADSKSLSTIKNTLGTNTILNFVTPQIGNRNGAYNLGTTVDEFMFFSEVKSASWISAYYKSVLSSTTNFLTFGTASSLGEEPVILISNETEFYNMSFLDEDPDFTWNFLENFEYDLQINTSDYWDGALIYDESGITETVTVTTLDNYTVYYARARGYNSVNATPYYTDWSDVKTFKTAFPPVITSPLDDAVISNNLNVPIEFDYGDSFGWIEISDDNFVTADYNNTFWQDNDIPLLENNKEYKIRVKGTSNGYLSGSPVYTTNWSEIITITTNLKPVIVYPKNAETITDTQDIELDWDPLGTAEGGSFLWYIDIAKDEAFTDINASYHAIDYQPTVTLNNGTWYWRIKGYENVDHYYSNYSDTAEFIVDYSSVQCNEDLEFTYPSYDATFPSNAVSIIWSEVSNASMYYVKIADNAMMEDALTYGLSGNNLDLILNPGSYYLDIRVKYLDDSYSQWLSICDQLHKFNVENPSIDVPTWVLPSIATVEEGLITFSWSEIENADRYWIQFYDNSTFDPDDLDDPALISQRVPTSNSIQLTLDSGFYWIVVKAEVDGDYSNWSSTKQLTVTVDGKIPEFDPEAKPTWITPEAVYLESGTIAYSWSSVVGATGYDIQISTSPTFSSYVLNTSTSNTYYTAYLNTSDEYYTRVRAKDPYYNGAWSLTKYFELVIEEVEYIYVPNTVNLYGGDILVYEFVGMEPDTTYTFKINSLDENGQFFQNIATKIVNSDGDGEASFTHVFSGSAFYPFEVRDNSNNYRLLTHFVAPRPTHLYLNADHRLEVNGSIISVAVGDVAYNTQSGILHDPYQPTQSLYEYGDYLLIHYSIPNPEDAIYGIVIKNIATGANVGIIASDDLYTFNRELGYAKRNFIVVSTNGVKPYIIDQWVELDDYTGDDWHHFNFEKGAYDYALLELDGDNTVIGESVILIGDDNIAEWALTVASATVTENSNQTFNFAVNTSEIWDAYNYMYFLDKSSGLFKIGSSSGYVKHPFSYQSSFTLTYPVTTEIFDDGAGRWGIKPFRYNFNADLEDVYYEYLIEKSFIITPVTDATDAIGSFLTLVGLGTSEGKLLFSLVGVIIGMVAVVLLGVPVGLAGLIGLIILAIFTALGFIPIWTIIIIGLGLFLLLLRTFLSGGGGE